MNRPLLSWLIALSAFIIATLSNGAAFADRRIALVIGNSHYNNSGLALSNPANDADDVAAALRDLGFEVIHKNDTTKRDLDLAMAQFARLATDADAALFFYAGHALQYQGRNYLMPTDAELEDEVSLRYQMMVLDDVRAALDRAGGIKIMILDACRNSPIVDRLRKQIAGATRSVENTRGLARIDKTQGMVVAYATAADDVAADGSGRNSPYTTALLKRLKEPGLEIEIMFRRIAADVNAQTNGRQRPETYVSLLNEYYLNQTDNILWEQIKDSADPLIFRNFIERFPSSKRSLDARNRLDVVQRMAREAARLLEEEKARAKVAAAEQERAEREAAQQRQQEEERAKVAAAAERQRAEREAAQRRQQEEERAKAAAAERQRVEREAAQQRQQEEERAKAAAAERQRVEREAAQQRQEEQRIQLALLERERLDREAAKRLQEQEEQRKKAEAARRGLERESGLVVVPTTARPQAVPTSPPQAAPSSIPQEQACKRDEETLARLRASQARDEVLRFEKELTCQRLRPQVARLRESLGDAAEQQPQVTQQQPQQQERPRPAPGPTLPSRDQQAAVKIDPAPISQAQACKQDEERLARLRASQARDEVLRFEKELTCERLRPQVLRLRESLGFAQPPVTQEPERPNRGVTMYGLDQQAAVKIDPAPISQAQACKQDEEKLVHLRTTQVREEVIRFEKELVCEKLRNQVLRLKESVGAN
jgi:uncharacterized caspase-like protein